MKRKFVVILAISIILICAGAVAGITIYHNQNPVVIFDKAVANINKLNAIALNNATNQATERDRLKDKTDDLLKKLGLGHYNKIEIINAEFVSSYLEKHTKEEFLKNTITICIFSRNHSRLTSNCSILNEGWHATDEADCQCQRLTTLLNLAFQANGIELKGVTSAMAGTPGYYTENPNVEPFEFEETHEGRFYDKDGTNGRTETKTDTGVVTYYGDYAILTVTRYSYQKGQYGWINGIVYDELPSWKKIQFSKLYYKGKLLQEADTASQLLSGKTCVIEINNILYAISPVSVQTETYAGYADTHTFMDIRAESFEE